METNQIDTKAFFAIAEQIKQMKEERKIGQKYYYEAQFYAKMLKEKMQTYYDLIQWFDESGYTLEQIKEEFE